MNKSAALTRLGLTGAADVHTITLAYTECLTQAQRQLASSQTDAGRQQSHATVAELVEAYELLTGMQRNTRGPIADNSTVIRSADEVETLAAASVPASAAHTGMVIAERLEIGQLLGQGGMGNVYAAHDRLKDEDVAIKVLRQDLSLSVAAKERFLAEAKVSCSLSHPNIVRVHDVGISGGQYYFSMERLKGQTLRQYMQSCQRTKRPMRLDEILGIVRQLFEALTYAHRYIVHRDLKPENIWLAADGTVKLMDFGIARAYSHSQITKDGMTLGTAYYMAPEQQKAAQEVDWRADQYSLGVVLYEMLSGTVPMGAATPLAKLRRDLPKRAARAVMRALAPKPADRWPSLDEMSEALHATPSHTGKIAAAVLLIGGIVGGKLGYEEWRTIAIAPLATTAATAYSLKVPEIVAPTNEVVLPEPGAIEIANNFDNLRPTGGVTESEIIETEFIEPERMQPVVQQRPVAQPVVQREVVYQAPVQIRTYVPEPRHEPHIDARRPPPGFMPPPPPPPGMRPPPPGRHPPPPRR